MPIQLSDAAEAFTDGEHYVEDRVKSFWSSFSDFALRDNVLEVAVGLILASAFTTIVNSFVSDILLPPLSLLPFINKNLDELFAVLRRGPHYDYKYGNIRGYNTLQQALDDGAVVLAFGTFLDKLISFAGVALSLFVLARIYGWAAEDDIIKPQRKCKFCRKWISVKAQRCVNCTSWQENSGHNN